MARSKKRSASTTAAEAAETTAPVVTSTPSSSAAPLANFFAQSAAFFGKKTSYVQPEPTETKTEAPVPQQEGDESSAVDEAEQVPPTATTTTDTSDGVAPADVKEKKKKKKKQKKNAKESNEESTEPEGEGENTNEPAQDEKADPEKSARTVFVGNVSLEATTKALKQFFSSCGKVESVRLRYLPVAGTAVDQHGNQKLMMKVCANKKIFSDKRDFCHAFVTFEAKESVEKALKLNRSTFLSKTIRVDHESPQIDPLRSVFVGNLSFHITDEAVWDFFVKHLRSEEEKEPVDNVRVIRDRETGTGKGFGYVLLKNKSLAAKALSLQGRKLEQREVRVQVCGKRFKNKKGDDAKRAKHEGVRAKPGAAARIALKRKTHDEPAPRAAMRDVKRRKTDESRPSKNSRAAGKKDVGKQKKVAGKRSRDASAPTPKVKAKKPKHAARKAKQAAEALKASKA
ncbi:hypothetical protein ATCC90586_001270 [Pythium insidiosum]|nr:hypothetical protein ATCC90586_001270 [Pythium insidiosum]